MTCQMGRFILWASCHTRKNHALCRAVLHHESKFPQDWSLVCGLLTRNFSLRWCRPPHLLEVGFRREKKVIYSSNSFLRTYSYIRHVFQRKFTLALAIEPQQRKTYHCQAATGRFQRPIALHRRVPYILGWPISIGWSDVLFPFICVKFSSLLFAFKK